MDQTLADKIIAQLERDYDVIADHFAQTRQHPWAEFGSLRTLIETENAENIELVDIGCGNGRLAEMLIKINTSTTLGTAGGINYVGVDLSKQLLTIAQQQFPQYNFVRGSILSLPFPDEHFDIVTCIATLQHIPSLVYRQQAMQEMKRVLKPGGIVFMMNWNLADQPPYQVYLTDQADGYDPGDYLIPWKNGQGEVLAQRYYHGFRIAELAELTEDAELRIIQNKLSPDKRNILTVARKT